MNSEPNRLDPIADAFESAWLTGSRPAIKEFLTQVVEQQWLALAKLLLSIDIEYRIKRGEKVSATDYQDLGVELQAAVESSFESQLAHRAADCDATKSMPPQQERKSTTIGNYKLLQMLGEGGMGTVWMAEQERPVRRRVALKLIKAGHDSKEVVARFEAERQALAMMDHQNIAKVLDAGTTETGQPFFVMELVQGIPFNKYCDKNKLSVNERLELFVPICNAVQHAHQKGIIHRDLKPSNVLVSLYDGKPVPKVIDFGLAKALQHQSKLTDKTLFTEFGQVVGTLQYMSPEQAEMNQLDVDTRTDVYSLGVMLYELLTGSTPIDQETLKNQAILKVLESIREKEPPRPSARLSSSTNEAVTGISEQRQIDSNKLKNILKGELDWIVMKALEKDRTRRYETANGFAEDVRRYLDGDVVAARPPSRTYQLRKYMRKHRSLVTSVLAFMILLSCGCIGMTLLWMNATIARRIADEKTVEAEVNERAAVRSAKDANDERAKSERLRARSDFNLAMARWDANRATEAVEYHRKIPEAYRGVEWELARERLKGSDVTCIGHTGEVSAVKYSHDGKFVVSASLDGTIRKWDAISGEALFTIQAHEKGVTCLAQSKDSKTIFSGGKDNAVKAWDASSGILLGALYSQASAVVSMDVNSDGTILASSAGNTIRFWSVSENTSLRTFYDSNTPSSLDFGAESKKLFYGTSNGKLVSFDVAKGFISEVSRGAESRVRQVSVSPDERKVAVAYIDWKCKIHASTKYTEEMALNHSAFRPQAISFSPNGKWVATGAEKVRIWSAVSSAEPVEFTGHDGMIACLEWSPDCQRVVSGGSDNSVRIWDCRNATRFRVLASGEVQPNNLSLLSSVAISDDNRYLVTTSWGGALRVWKVAEGELVREMLGAFTQAAFKPNSWEIASSDKSGKSIVWNAETGDKVSEYPNTGDSIASIAFSNDGELLAAANAKGKLTVWDSTTTKQLASYSTGDDQIKCIAFHPNGKTIGVGCFTQPKDTHAKVVLWSLDGLVKEWMTPAGSASLQAIAFNSDGSKLAVCVFLSDKSQSQLSIIETATLETVCASTVRALVPSSGVAFTLDGKRVVSSWTDKTVRIHDIERGEEAEEVLVLKGHSRGIQSIAISKRGDLIASGGSLGEVFLWETETDTRSYQQNKSRLDVWWQEKEARQAEADKNWYAAMFHRKNILTATPNSAQSHINLSKSVEHWKSINKESKLTNVLTNEFDTTLEIPIGTEGTSEELWEAGRYLQSKKKSRAFEYYALAVRKSLKDGVAVDPLTQARVVWLMNQILSSRTESKLGDIELEFLRNSVSTTVDPDKQRIVMDYCVSSKASTIIKAIWNLDFQTLDFATRVEANRLEIKVVFIPSWRCGFVSSLWWGTTTETIQKAEISNSKIGFEHKKTVINELDGTVYYSKLWHRTNERFAKFNQLKELNASLWKHVVHSAAEPPSPGEVNRFAILCKEFSVRNYYNTLGVAQYRLSDFENAIQSLSISCEKVPLEMSLPGPHPGDLAFLAMSHLRLKHDQEAKDFHAKFNAAMKHDAYKNDAECVGFAKEVEALFQPRSTEVK